MMRKTLLGIAMAVAVLPFSVGAKEIAPVGTTDVTVDPGVLAFLTGAGIAPSPLAPATLSGATFMFPITGGETDTLFITHMGGVRLDDGTNFVEVSDFEIDGLGGMVSGTVFGSADAFDTPFSADLFELDDVVVGDPITATLLFTETLNTALGLTFLDDPDALNFTGEVFGTAVTSPSAVPLPAGLPLIAGAIGLLALVRRRAA